jgi:hypothetical protein
VRFLPFSPFFFLLAELPMPGKYVYTGTHLTPLQHSKSKVKVSRNLFVGKRVVLFLTDSFCSHYTITHANRTFQFRFDPGRATRFTRRADGRLPTTNLFGECGYRVIDRCDHDKEADSDLIIFQLSGSGMALRWAEHASQALLPSEWKDYVYWAFNLAPDFNFDAVFISMGTNDIKCLVSNKVLKRKYIVDGTSRDEVLPINIAEFVTKVCRETISEFSKEFQAPTCWFGGGVGGIPASQIQTPGNERFAVTAIGDAPRNIALGRLFNALNLQIVRSAKQYFDRNGRALGRVSLFGISLPDQPHSMTIAGAGHAVSRFYSYFATAYRNSIELMTFKLGLRLSGASPMLIAQPCDSRRWVDVNGHVTPFEPTYWDPVELNKKHPKWLTKVSTNGELPLLAPLVEFPSVSKVNEVFSAPRKFEFGQLGFVKRPDAKYYEKPEPCIVVDGSLDHGVLFFNMMLRILQFVPHELFVVPSGLAVTKREDQRQFRAYLFEQAQQRLVQQQKRFGGDLGSSREFPRLASFDPQAGPSRDAEDEDMDVDPQGSSEKLAVVSVDREEGEIVEEGGLDAIGVDESFDHDNIDPLVINEDVNTSQDQNEEGEHVSAGNEDEV